MLIQKLDPEEFPTVTHVNEKQSFKTLENGTLMSQEATSYNILKKKCESTCMHQLNLSGLHLSVYPTFGSSKHTIFILSKQNRKSKLW